MHKIVTGVIRRSASFAYRGGEFSLDIHGAGSIVVVPSPGHTPGSVAVFVTLPGDRRFALLGDLAWQLEGILHVSERPLLTRMGDADAPAVREELAKVAAMHARHPRIRLVPAHDPRAYAALPPLERSH